MLFAIEKPVSMKKSKYKERDFEFRLELNIWLLLN